MDQSEALRPPQNRILMFPRLSSRDHRAALLWVTVFLLVPYVLLFCYSFWSVSPSQEIVHSWTLDNYRQL